MWWLLVGLVVGGAVGWYFRRRTVADTTPSNEAEIDDTPTSVEPRLDVVEAHSVGVIVMGATGVIDYRNAAATAFTGTHVGVLIDECASKHLQAARNGEPSSETLDLFGPPAAVLTVHAEPLADQRAVAFITDVTAQRRSDRARSDFVANVSHELRTPIGALVALADTLVGVEDPDVLERLVGRMQGEAERAAATIEDLLELSQLDTGETEGREPVRLSDVIRDAMLRVSELAERRGVAVAVLEPVENEFPDGLLVSGDRRQLASAVGNVIENAVKYSEHGGNVQVRSRRADGWCEVLVTDQGPGIPQTDLDRIFERFYRVDRARSRSTGGTGLGLAIVRRAVENHGGSIEVESVEGAGSTFVLRFPLSAVAPIDDAAPINEPVELHDEGIA